MKKALLTVVLVFLLLPLGDVFAAPKSKAKKPSPQTVEQYSTQEINLGATKLPPSYYGNDVEAIYQSIEQREKQKEKDEFETTEQYNKRIEYELHKPLIGSLSLGGYFVFKSVKVDSNYNADTQEFKISIPLEDIRESVKVNRSKKGILIKKVLLNIPDSIGQNAFGATVTIKHLYVNNWNIAISNFKHISSTIKVLQEEARNAKENIAALVIVKLDNPYISKGGIVRDATINDPTEFFASEKNVNAKLAEIWFYNIKTGQIYKKVIEKVEVEKELARDREEAMAREEAEARERARLRSRIIEGMTPDQVKEWDALSLTEEGRSKQRDKEWEILKKEMFEKLKKEKYGTFIIDQKNSAQ